MITAKLLDQFTALTKKSIGGYINDLIAERLKSALKSEEAQADSSAEDTSEADMTEAKINTTNEELEAFMIIKSICREKIDVSRLFYRDAQNYFSILLDDNNRKYICRMYFNTSNKYVATIDENKKEVKHLIESLNDLYKYSNEYFKAIDMYDKKELSL